jgi:hypothetical protein
MAATEELTLTVGNFLFRDNGPTSYIKKKFRGRNSYEGNWILISIYCKQLIHSSHRKCLWTHLFKIWGFHDGDYEEWCLLGYKNPFRTSQETHYVSTTESSQLMLCKIWGFHDGDYEEWCLLGYKNPFCTSQETHYVSTTESSQLILCKICGFHGGDYEEWCLLGVTPCDSCKNRRFGGTWRLLNAGDTNRCTRNNTSFN